MMRSLALARSGTLYAYAVLLGVGAACAGAVSRVSGELTGDRVLQQAHSRYSGKRFTHVTFVQATTHADGTTETWFEALAPLGRVRVDISPLEARNGFMYRADSQYVYRNGSVIEAHANQRWLSMLVLLDIYALPLDSVLNRARELGVQLDRAHVTTWRGRPTYVAGAFSGDTSSPQVWYDEQHLYPVRLIQRGFATGTWYDWDISDHIAMSGGWIEREIRIYSGGRLLVTEKYDRIVPRQTLPDSLFLPAPYRPPGWLSRMK